MKTRYAFLGFSIALAVAPLSFAADPNGPQIRVVNADPGDSPYYWLLKGDPETKSFRSGVVTLAPGKSVGFHNTEKNEEMLVPLEGQGELQFKLTDHAPIAIRPGLITYAPAHVEHNVVNTGSTSLRYIFITAKAEQ
jgi:mannose-6-phosphate isomerase-like protein (cupin superfamily)